MDRCTGHHDVTEMLLKGALNTMQSIKLLPASVIKSLNCVGKRNELSITNMLAIAFCTPFSFFLRGAVKV